MWVHGGGTRNSLAMLFTKKHVLKTSGRTNATRLMFRRALIRAATGAVGAGFACTATGLASGAAAEGAVPAQPKPAVHLFSLEGRKALVTGGSKGLGEAVARGLV